MPLAPISRVPQELAGVVLKSLDRTGHRSVTDPANNDGGLEGDVRFGQFLAKIGRLIREPVEERN